MPLDNEQVSWEPLNVQLGGGVEEEERQQVLSLPKHLINQLKLPFAVPKLVFF